MNQDYNRSPGKRTLPNVIKSLKKLGKKGTTGKIYCQNPGCNNVIDEDGVAYNYCSDSCQLANANPFEDNSYEEAEDVWSPGGYQNKKTRKSNDVYTSYSSSSFKRNNSRNSTSSYIRNQDSSGQSASEWNSQVESSEDYPVWYNSSLDMKWKSQKINNSNNNIYPSQSRNSDQEIECSTCMYFVRPDRTTCEMCGTIVRRENNRVGRESKRDVRENNRPAYENNDDLDDLYVGSPRSRNSACPTYENNDDDLDDPCVGSPRSRNNACPTCTYHVRPGSTTCEICGTIIRKENNIIRRESNISAYENNDDDDLDDLYVGSSRSKSNACPTCTYHVRPGSTTCEMCGTAIKKENHIIRRESNRVVRKYNDDVDDLDDLYVGSPESKNNACPTCTYHVRPGSTRCEMCGTVIRKENNKNIIEDDDDDDDDDDLYMDPVRKKNNKNRIEYNDDDLYIGPVRGENNKSRTEYDDNDLYMGPPSPNVFSSTKPKRQQLPTPPPQTTDTDQIPCPECLYMNHPLMVNCERCAEVLNQGSGEHVDNDLLLLQLEAEQYDFKVLCPSCSFLNAGFAAQCEMCFLPISDGLSTSKENTDMVQCSKCTFMNHIYGLTCEICNEDLPGAAEQRRAYEEFYNNTTRMIPMNATDPDYINVQRRFLAGLPNARIQAIVRMIMPRRLVDAHENYKTQTGFRKYEMFHGTSVACRPERYYDNSNAVNFCTANCGLCGISQHGNLCSVSRHGGRMWFARSSSISLGYCGAVPIKAMFSVDVINRNAQDIIIVDKEAATLVKFLILYQV